jgi:hypothetical protein
MGDYRVLGRDATLRLTQGNVLLAETTAIKDINFKVVQTLISEGFIGEAAKRHREVFDEVDLTFNVEPEGKEILEMQYAIYQRARGGQNDLQINVGFRIAFPSGVIARITVPDLKFGQNGDLAVPNRESFITMAFAAKSSKYIPSFA